MITLNDLKESVLHLLFPHICTGCGSDLVSKESFLCLRCIHDLPVTGYEWFPGNPVEKLFWGRLPLVRASATCYFTKHSLMQHLMHEVKYHRNQELAIFLGRLMGTRLKHTACYLDIDALVPLPLFPARERERGFNQAKLLCDGIAEILHIPVLDRVVRRRETTDSQTRKGRIERWQNMAGKFELTDPPATQGMHLLLVDDVVTTGATLESCGNALLGPGVLLSIATLCYSSR